MTYGPVAASFISRSVGERVVFFSLLLLSHSPLGVGNVVSYGTDVRGRGPVLMYVAGPSGRVTRCRSGSIHLETDVMRPEKHVDNSHMLTCSLYRVAQKTQAAAKLANRTVITPANEIRFLRQIKVSIEHCNIIRWY